MEVPGMLYRLKLIDAKKKLALLMLAILAVLISCGIAFAVSAQAQAFDDPSLTVIKTAEWTNRQKTNANITITADAKGKLTFKKGESTTPKILFVGSLNNGGSIQKSDYLTTLNELTKIGDLDYRLCYNGKNTRTGAHIIESKSVKKGTSISSIPDLNSSNDVLKDMLNCLDDAISDDNSYDAVILQFRNNSIATNYSQDTALESRVANKLIPYYENDKVAWITGTSGTNTEYIRIQDFGGFSHFYPSNNSKMGMSLTAAQYKAMRAMICPDLYSEAGSVIHEERALPCDRQTNYRHGSNDSKSMAIEEIIAFLEDMFIEKYSINFEDTIDVASGLSINSCKIETSQNGDIWTESSIVPTILGDKVIANIDKLRKHNYVRLIINVNADSGFEGDPNLGNAHVSMTSERSSQISAEATTAELLDQSIHIKYKSENPSLGSVSVDEERASITSDIAGSKAQPIGNHSFLNWTNSEGKVVSNQELFVPPKVDGINYDDVYTAHFSEMGLSTEKVAKWNEDGTIEISITANASGKGQDYVPNILFVGTLCSAHTMDKPTIVNSLNTLSATSNVDYYLFNKGQYSTYDFSGSIAKGNNLTEYETNAIKLHTNNHYALGKFLDLLHKQLELRGSNYYDFIVLEFDGTRIADKYNDTSDKYSTNAVSSNEANTCAKLLKYYNNKRIIWVTDDESGTKSTANYYPTYKYYNGQDRNLAVHQYNSLMSLICPSLYGKVKSLAEYSDNGLSSDRQTNYKHPEAMAEFLAQAIESLKLYRLDFDDKIHIDENLNILDAKLLSSNDGINWEEYTGPQEIKIDKDHGDVYAKVTGLVGNKYLKLTVQVEDPGHKFQTSSASGDPNDGDASVSMTSGDETVYSDAFTEEPLNWPIVINYITEDPEKGSVSDASEEAQTNTPREELKGSTPLPKEAYDFDYWERESDHEKFYDQSMPFQPEQNEYGRNFPDTYIAHFKDRLVMVDYVVYGDQSWHTPSDSVTPPADPSVLWGTTNYELEDHPTTSWTTSDGKANGIPGDWSLTAWYSDEACTVKIPDDKLNEVKDNTTVYGKWTFVPEHYKVSYVVKGDTNYDNAKPNDPSSLAPATDPYVEWGTDYNLAPDASTTWNTLDGTPDSTAGTWSFTGWYPSEACAPGTEVDIINVKSDRTVYGQWKFTPKNWTVDYTVVPDDTYGAPSDAPAPDAATVKDFDPYTVSDKLNTNWNTATGINDDGARGQWTCTLWSEDSTSFEPSIDFYNHVQENKYLFAKWTFTPIEHSVRYHNVPDQSWGLPKITEMPEDASVVDRSNYNVGTIANTPWETHDGTDTGIKGAWSFKGWSFDKSGAPQETTINGIVKDYDLYGKWSFTPDQHRIDYWVHEDPSWGKPQDSYEPNDAAVEEGSTYNFVDPITTIYHETQTGVKGDWEFVGWCADKDCATEIIDKYVDVRENKSIYGKWIFSPYGHNVHYDVKGDTSYGIPADSVTPADASVDHGATCVLDQTCTTNWTTCDGQEGSIIGVWDFAGWSSSNKYEDQIKQFENVTTDKTAYGKWTFTPKNITVKFDKQGHGDYDPADQVFSSGNKTTEPSPALKESEWIFGGWYETPDCQGDPYDFDKPVIDDKTLYAKWIQVDPVTIYYVAETGGSVTDSSESLLPISGEAKGSTAIPDAENGYEFDYWSLKDSTEVLSTDPNYAPSKEAEEEWIDGTTYVAHFKHILLPLSYNVIGDTNYKGARPQDVGAAVPAIDPSVEYDTTNYKLAPTSTTNWNTLDGEKDGMPGKWEFTGWCYDSDYTQIIKDGIYEGPILQETVVYGKWMFVPEEYKVDYVVKGDTPWGDKVPQEESALAPESDPSVVWGTNYSLAKKRTTTWVTLDGTDNSPAGTWDFTGWCEKGKIDKQHQYENIVVKEDRTVYGLWTFTPKMWTVDYTVAEDPSWGIPENKVAPDASWVVDKASYTVEKPLSTSWTTSTGDLSGTKGKWTFTGWSENWETYDPSKTYFESVTEDKHLFGKWTFEPVWHSVAYKVNPDPELGIVPELDWMADDASVLDNEAYIIPGKPHTNWSTSDGTDKGIHGSWVFTGWHQQTPDEIKEFAHVTQDELLIGEYKFVPDKYNVDYWVDEDPSWGLPGDVAEPEDASNIPGGSDYVIANPLQSERHVAKGVEGDWVFTGWSSTRDCDDKITIIERINENHTVYGKWKFEPYDHKVTYIVESDASLRICPGDASVPADASVSHGGSYDVEQPCKTTWTTADGEASGVKGQWQFTGWTDDKAYQHNVNDTTLTNVISDKNLYGKWVFVPEKHAVTYFVDHDEWGIPEGKDAPSSFVVNDCDDVSLEAPLTTTWKTSDGTDFGVKGEWKFTGWTDDKAYQHEVTGFTEIRENKYVYGKWEFAPFDHNVHYDVTGDASYGIPTDAPVPTDASVDHGATYHVEEVCKTDWHTCDGNEGSIIGTWEFNGWSSTEKIDDKIVQIINVTEDKNIYGKWTFTPKNVSLSFDKQGHGDYDPSTQVFPSGTKGIEPKPLHEDEWIFDGWYENPECTGEPFDFNNPIIDDKIVYAKWTSVDPVTIYYEAKTGGYVTDASESLLPFSGIAKGSTAVPDSENGYEFDRWTDASGETVSTDANYAPQKTGEKWIDGTTYYAYFKHIMLKLNYEVYGDKTYGLPGDSVTPDTDPSVEYDTESYKLADHCISNWHASSGENAGVPGKWTFSGWYTDNSFTTLYKNDTVDGPIQSDTTVYGKWNFTPDVYNVYFDLQGHEVPGPKDQSVTYGEYAQRPDEDPEDPGYTFEGWYKDPDCTTPFNFEETPIINDTTIYAQWEEVDHITIKYEADKGGSVDPSSEHLNPITAEKAKGSTADPAPGYEFVNWTDKDTGEPVGPNPKFVPERQGERWEPKIYVAHFEPAMTITKCVDPSGADVTAGDTITYTLTVNNNSSKMLEAASVSDRVPDGLVDITPADKYNPATRTITFGGLKIAAGASINLQFSATVPLNISKEETYVNKANLHFGLSEELESNEVKTKAIPKVTKLIVHKEWSDAMTTHDNDSIKFKLFKNSVKGDCFGTYEINKDSQVEGVPWTCEVSNLLIYDVDGSKINYVIAELDNNGNIVDERGILQFDKNRKYSVNYNYGQVADLSAYTTSIVNTYVPVASNLKIKKTTDQKRVKPGDNITYNISVINTTNNWDAANITVNDPLPEGLTFVSAEAGGVYDKDNNQVNWNIDKLAHGATKSFTLVCHVPEDTKIAVYENIAVIDGYKEDIPDQSAPKSVLEPEPLDTLGIKISKTIIRNDIDYIFTNEEAGNRATLRYYCFMYKTDILYNPVIEDTLPLGLEPDQSDPDYKEEEWSLDQSTHQYTFKRQFTDKWDNPVPGESKPTPVDVSVKLADKFDEKTWLISDSRLSAKVTEEPTSRVLTAESNKTEMLVDVPPEPVKPDEPAVTEVKDLWVDKVWQDGEAAHKKDSVVMTLYQDGLPYGDPVVLKDGKWSYTWLELPIFHADKKTVYVYEIKETKGIDGYEASYQKDELGNTTVTNNKKIVPPPGPDPEPVPEPIPAEDARPLVQTGDLLTIALIFGAIVVSAWFACLAYRIRKKR